MSPRVRFLLHERVWHWIQALTVMVLLASGAQLHFPRLGLFDYATAVRVHDAFAALLLLNAFLGLFYFLTSGLLRQFLPEPRDVFTLGLRQVRWYLGGMFRGEPHPIERDVHRKLSPLQKLSYAMTLNLLLPLQMITGVLIWGASRWPRALEAVGGLPLLLPLHTLGAWLMAAFTLLHLYLITTGETPGAHLRAMITGGEEDGA